MSSPVSDNDKVIKITSYVPIFREPPSDAPWKLLFQGYTNSIKACNLGIDMPVAHQSMHNISLCLQVLDAVLENYLRWHKQYVVVGDVEQLRLLYAISLLFQFRQRWDWYANYPSPFVAIDVQAQVMPPDELLDFNYVLATYDLNGRLLKGALSWFSDRAIHTFMMKRHKDPRYKFIQPCMLKPAYWRNPKYWNGFKAGLLVDFVMFKVACRQTRRHLWESYTIAGQTNMLFKAIKLDERVVKAFQDQFLIDKLWELIVSRVAGLSSNLRYYGVPNEVTERIDRMILEPDKLKEELK